MPYLAAISRALKCKHYEWDTDTIIAQTLNIFEYLTFKFKEFSTFQPSKCFSGFVDSL
jgi:hypothetical protein